MEIEELLLAAAEHPHVDGLCGVDAHPLKRGAMRDWRNDERTVIFEPNEPTIKQVVDARR